MEMYFVINGISINEVSPVAYDKQGDMIIGVNKGGNLYVKEELASLIEGTPYKMAISNTKMTLKELEELLNAIVS